MPREISGLRIARSYVTPTESAVERVLDFQLGARQGIQIHSVLGEVSAGPGTAYAPSTSTVTELDATHTLHLESGSLETVQVGLGGDEDTIDSEIFYRQHLSIIGNDDAATEFRASMAISVTPSGVVDYPRPLFSARNITHRGVTSGTGLDAVCHVIIFYTFVEFSLAELGLILARRT